MERRKHKKARVGIFGIGLSAYWQQFPGLKETLEAYQREIEDRIRTFGVEVVSAGLIDDAAGGREAGDLFARENVDLFFCYAATYATSSQVLPAVQRIRRHVVILNLQPVSALDYEHADTRAFLTNCGSCPVPEISCALTRAGIPFNVVTGVLRGDEKAWGEIREWCGAASAAVNLQRGRIGFLGHTYPGMLDMYTDFTAVSAQLGSHVEILEMCDLDARVQRVTEREVSGKMEKVRKMFCMAKGDMVDSITKEPSRDDLLWAARVSCGIDSMVSDFDLDALTYYYRGLDGNLYEKLSAGMILGNTMLTSAGVPAAGEGDMKTCIAMLVMECLDAGGSFTEFVAMDFNEGFVLMGHDGPGHVAISDEKPVLRGLSLYHGKRGYGVSVEFRVKTGPVTILGLTQTANGSLKLMAAEGESLAGTVMPIGNTNSRLKFALPPADFVTKWCEEGPTHHVALGAGHVLGKISKAAKMLNLELKVISG